MARLAAYYQEDFHYVPVGTAKQRKAAAYVLYDQPVVPYAGGKTRALMDSSEPALTPKTAVMTLRAPRPQNRMSVQRLYDRPPSPEYAINPYAIARYEADAFDCEYGDETYVKQRTVRDRTCKRLSYDSFDGYHRPPSRMADDRQHFRTYPEGSDDCCCRVDEDCILPPVSFRSDSSHGRWQQWPWADAHTVLSPPSPLDSGLSSQSVTTSSPTSLDASEHACCSCSCPTPSRYDSGRSSPGAYSTSRRKSKRRPPDSNVYCLSQGDQVRYGMLGIVGEPPDTYDRPPAPRAAYYYVEEDTVPLKPPTPYDRPTVVITEATDPSSTSPTLVPLSSPEESSVNASKSSSGEEEDRRKKTERDIRELEDMYRQCNLTGSDWSDLLERADRRETVHQTRSDQTLTRPLARSKSDTLYEESRVSRRRQRAPPLRRSGVPDIVADDMALRKNSRPTTVRPFDPNDRTVTYMLCSSHFTPTVPSPDLLLPSVDRPDVEHDDWSYRKHYVGKGGPDLPQPPFGIPLRPPPPVRHSDYLRQAVPANGRHTRPLCHPRGNPDVVRDDLAYRTLRKDEDGLYYEASDVYRKKRA